MPTRVAIYARASTVNHGQDVSLQTRELRQFAEARGWIVAGEYIDSGVSGAKDSRPERSFAICKELLGFQDSDSASFRMGMSGRNGANQTTSVKGKSRVWILAEGRRRNRLAPRRMPRTLAIRRPVKREDLLCIEFRGSRRPGEPSIG